MKGNYIQQFLFIALIAAASSGCQPDDHLERKPRKVEVVLEGAIGVPTRAAVERGANGLPTEQMTIGILTGNYEMPTDKTKPEVSAADWGMYTYLDRGYFGGPGLNATNISNGEIKYTNAAGTAIQSVFYDEAGMYYIFRAIYPFIYKIDGEETGPELLLASNGSLVSFPVDGTQDIMTTNLGWGNMETKYEVNGKAGQVLSDSTNHKLVFRHHLVRLDLKVSAAANAAEQYGKIGMIELIKQPNRVLYDITTDTLTSYSDLLYSYKMEGFPSDSITLLPPQNNVPVKIDAGSVMALPASKYTFRIPTGNRLNFYIDLVFPENLTPGTAFPITLEFKDAGEVILTYREPTHWWLDSTFN